MFEDAYIYLHVVQNLLAGNGPVFNAGHRVEVFTGPLWTFSLAAGGLLTPFSLEATSMALGIGMTLAGLSIAILGSARLIRQIDPSKLLLPIGALVFIAIYPVWLLASSGLETGITFLWLGGCLAILATWSSTIQLRLSWYGIVILGLGPLIRPELLLDSAIFVVVVLIVGWADRTWSGRLRIVLLAVSVPLAYQVFRMGYFGELVANTAFAKEGSRLNPHLGIEYLKNFVNSYWLFVPAALLLAGAYLPLGAALWRVRGNRALFWAFVALPIAGVSNAIYVTLIGGDYLHARLLVPAFFACCAPIAVVPAARRYAISFFVAPWILAAAISLRPLPSLYQLYQGTTSIAQGGWHEGSPLTDWYRGKGIYVDYGIFDATQIRRVRVEPGKDIGLPALVTPTVGQVAFYFGPSMFIQDRFGIADPLTSHFLLLKRGFPGHEKLMSWPWLAAVMTKNGSSIVPFEPGIHVENALTFAGNGAFYQAQMERFKYRAPTKRFTVEADWARSALTCPAIHDIEYSPNSPLTFAGFFENIVHSFGRYSLRIPMNPRAAYREFCGPGIPAEVRHGTTGVR